MRIAVISDTHDHYPASLPASLKAADEIWHLGDVCAPTTLVEFELLGRPLHIVGGNCDEPGRWPLALDLEREGVRFHLTHIPPLRAPPGVAVLLHGHTHVSRNETDASGVRWLNPGAVSRPRGGGAASFAWLTVASGTLTGWRVVGV